MILTESPLWVTDGLFPSLDRTRPLPERVDIAVVGGGLTGLSAARSAAQRGARVALFEQHTLGWGASSRNGGMVLTGLKLAADTLVARYGLALAQQMFAASLAAIDCVEQIVAEERLACDFARCGHLLVAYKPGHMRLLEAEAGLLARTFGHQTQVVTRADLHTEIGSRSYYGGLVDPVSAGIDPARFVAGLAHAALRAGAQVYEDAPIHQITRAGGGFQVATARGVVRADTVLIATGGYTGAATPRLRRRIIPIGSYTIATERLPEALAQELIPRNRMVFDTKHFLYYFRLTPDRRLLFGGRANFSPATPRTVRESAALLTQAMTQVYPQLRSMEVAFAWGGTLDFTFDMMPHIGEIDGLQYALGYAGHGVAMATYLGSLLAARAASAGSDTPFASPLPCAPLGLYDGRPWFLPFAGAWYRLLDFVH